MGTILLSRLPSRTWPFAHCAARNRNGNHSGLPRAERFRRAHGARTVAHWHFGCDRGDEWPHILLGASPPAGRTGFPPPGLLCPRTPGTEARMKFGIDRLLSEPELRAPLEGKRVALLAHPASVTAD